MSEYLKRQLIAYIGNKRSLLTFLGDLFRHLTAERTPGVFLDAFAGSGSVARLARTLGFEVHANDWEPYSLAMNRAYLTLTPDTAREAFAPWGGLEATLRRLNQLKAPQGEEFLARWYAPRATATADWRTERLFYTRENALWLDAVREAIDGLQAEGPARDVLLALLVYEASVHSNTSGVFKAFHKGFGGHGGDALTRILAPMELEYPELWPSPRKASASSLDARVFLSGRSADLIYLDPPYNQHQYGSNYHLLNTVVLGDRFVPSLKAGIRRDWVKTRSPFCSRSTAEAALSEVLGACDARHIVISYNTEGVIPFERLYDLLDRRGRVDLAVQDYVTYRGGRQSPGRRTHNLEFCLVVDTTKAPRSGSRTTVDHFFAQRKLATVLKSAFDPSRLRQAFPGAGTLLDVGDRQWATEDLHRFSPLPDVTGLGHTRLDELLSRLTPAACQSHQEEFRILLELIRTSPASPFTARRLKRLVLVLRKFAFRQYRAEFEQALQEALLLSVTFPQLVLPIDELTNVAQRRFAPR